MDLIGLLIVVLVLGLILYLIQTLPIAEPFRTIAYVVLVVIVIIWLLGMLSGHVGVPRLR